MLEQYDDVMCLRMTYGNGCEDVLNEQNPLEFQHKEVYELMELSKNAFEV